MISAATRDEITRLAEKWVMHATNDEIDGGKSAHKAMVAEREFILALDSLVSEPQGQSGKLPEDLFTHKDAWRAALECALVTVVDTDCENDNKSYWEHELKVFDRVFAALEAQNG